MAEEATTSEMPVGCLGQTLPLTAAMPCSHEDGSPHSTEAGPETPAATTDSLAPAMDGPAGSAVPLDVPETTERAAAPSETKPEAGPSPASDQAVTYVGIGPENTEAVTANDGKRQSLPQ